MLPYAPTAGGGGPAAGGPQAALECLLRNGADPHAWTKQGASPLHVAAAAGNAPACSALIERGGARVWGATTDGATALHLAARHGRVAVTALLLGLPDCSVRVAIKCFPRFCCGLYGVCVSWVFCAPPHRAVTWLRGC